VPREALYCQSCARGAGMTEYNSVDVAAAAASDLRRKAHTMAGRLLLQGWLRSVLTSHMAHWMHFASRQVAQWYLWRGDHGQETLQFRITEEAPSKYPPQL